MIFWQPRKLTIAEIVVAVVLLGLAFGAFLTAGRLVQAADAKNTITDMRKFQSAINGFVNKFDHLPGDFPKAVAFLSADSENGNGNSIVELENKQGAFEDQLFWNHLSLSKLLGSSERYYGTGDYVISGNVPPSSISDTTGYTVENTDGHGPHAIYLGSMNMSLKDLSSPSITPKIAQLIDKKLDDGAYYRGKATGDTFFDGQGNEVSTCAKTGEYDLSNGNIACRFKMEID
jgi:hypothetical protein